MCGIIGYVGSKDATPILQDGLRRLEYRGYDSAGVAVLNASGKLDVVKREGKVATLSQALCDNPIFGNIGIGHTRWATHGEPSDLNSHPHLSQNEKFVVVHNGIIENYQEIKEKLEGLGFVFVSETDTEVIAHLLEHYYNGDLLDVVAKVAGELTGAYALGIISADNPDVLATVKKDSPLIVGVLDGENIIASDIPAVLPYTNKVHYMNDGEIAFLSKEGVAFYDLNKNPLEKQPETIGWDAGDSEKGEYPTFMLKEMFEQSLVIEKTIQSALSKEAKETIDNIDIAKFKRIIIVGCGSAYNAGMVGKYVLERLCRVNVEIDLASEFIYKNPIVDETTLVVLISQSGETADTLKAMKMAKDLGATTLSIVNVRGSAIARGTDHLILTEAGLEIAVATTKAFSSQLVVLYVLAIRFAQKLGKMSDGEAESLIEEIKTLPQKVGEVLENYNDFIKEYAQKAAEHKNIFFIGRNVDFAISLEGSLKLKEISYIHSEAYAGGELKHGPIALVDEDSLVVATSCTPALYDKLESGYMQVMARGANVFFVGNTKDVQNSEKLTAVRLPQINEFFSPSLSVVAFQLLSYHVAATKDVNIDMPRNLAKSVTVE
ncbi:MAG: glutamine--fructose-6-phosphate transaminase (isomerizing) [Defluviitaleaceae bacterium]|nr:glutamine--fructose-6-phosphate transaminase (isomerizing) [Defluviitaleaceae bacterium]